MKVTVIALIAACLAAGAFADIYMHNPRGSNNRVDDNNNAPANRMFDSQNNNQAGYNSGGDDVEPMKYYVGSELMVSWTVQHGCGVNPATHCDMIVQYRCDELMRDGTSRQQPEDPPANGDEPSADRGRHEPYVNWQECDVRERNGGLFIADQNVGDQASSTRQNGGGNRSGYECAEERDYYPYWHPSYWKDIAIMTDNTTRCEYYQAESQNVKGKNACSDPVYNNEDDCTQNDGSWDIVPAWGIEAPDCVLAPWSRLNLHGNAITPGTGTGTSMEQAHYNVSMMNEPSEACILRVRYNISSDDYDGWYEFDARYNDELSPVQNDPVVNLGVGTDLELNINTAQFGRTFEDRSHVFQILERPAEIDDDTRIYNINVRGKRGNNAATYPNNEYDFIPNRLHVGKNEYVHWQWTGSNNNPQGTDRSNVVQTPQPGINYPADADEMNMWTSDEIAYQAASNCGSEDQNLQDGSPYCDVGLVQYPEEGTFHYMSTKNNAYTNRAQKGTVIVGGGSSSAVGMYVGIGLGGAAVLGAGAAAAVFASKRGGGGSSARF